MFPDCQSDDVEVAIQLHKTRQRRVWGLSPSLGAARRRQDAARAVGIDAQREFVRSTIGLSGRSITKASKRQAHPFPDWEFIRESIAWRDLFERLCGVAAARHRQNALGPHRHPPENAPHGLLAEAYDRLNHTSRMPSGDLADYDSLVVLSWV